MPSVPTASGVVTILLACLVAMTSTIAPVEEATEDDLSCLLQSQSLVDGGNGWPALARQQGGLAVRQVKEIWPKAARQLEAQGTRGALDSYEDGGQMWPVFKSEADLRSDTAWHQYLLAVYGEVPASAYPIDISEFWLLYPDELQKAGVLTASQLQSASECPWEAKAGTLYKNFDNTHNLPWGYWILHLPPFQAIPDSTWVEVIHSSYGTFTHRVENHGAWFYYARGSGIWFNLGKTKTFAEHHESLKFFGTPYEPNRTWRARLAQRAAASGYDSLQYVNYQDGGTCDWCCVLVGLKVSKVEIVATKLQGKYACAEPAETGAIRAGWMGSRPCHCSEDGHLAKKPSKGVPMTPMINCKGVPRDADWQSS